MPGFLLDTSPSRGEREWARLYILRNVTKKQELGCLCEQKCRHFNHELDIRLRVHMWKGYDFLRTQCDLRMPSALIGDPLLSDVYATFSVAVQCPTEK